MKTYILLGVIVVLSAAILVLLGIGNHIAGRLSTAFMRADLSHRERNSDVF